MKRFLKGNDFRGNFLQRLFFCWMDPLLFKGFRRKINETDLHECARDVESRKLYTRFEKFWNVEIDKLQRGGKASLILALAKTTYLNCIMCAIFLTLQSITLPAVAIFYLYFTQSCSLNFLDNSSTLHKHEIEGTMISLGWAVALSISILLAVVFWSIGFTYSFIQGMQLRIVCIAAIYKKILRLQQTSINKLSIGHIINVMSNDVQRFDYITEFTNCIPATIIQLPIIITVIVLYVGPIGLLGLLIVLLHLPIEIVLTRFFGYFKKKICEITDKRAKMMDQITRGIRVIKMYGWEKAFLNYISKLRGQEIAYASLSGITQSNALSLYGTSMFVGLFATYLTSIGMENPLSPSIIGLYSILLHIVRTGLVLQFGYFLFLSKEIILSCKRIECILQLPENIQTCIEYKPLMNRQKIHFKNFCASWKELDKLNDLVLTNLNLEISGPIFGVVVGKVGSGKSSLLLSIANELAGFEGKLEVTGNISYSPQEAWIFSGTIRDNILLGNHLTSERYNRVLEITCLNVDIQSLENGDLSLIGERGITLSGGQKARVTLARALYREADIYLLDDPLSAVDAIVGRYIFNDAIKGFLNGKLVILVTHLIHFANMSDYVVVMDNGDIELKRKLEDVTENLISNVLQSKNEHKCMKMFKNFDKQFGENMDLNIFDETVTASSKIQRASKFDNLTLSQSLTEEETQSGSVNFLIYLKFFTIGGYIWPILLIIVTIISNGGRLASLWYVQEWSRCYYCPSDLINISYIAYSNQLGCDKCHWVTTLTVSQHTWNYCIITVSGIVCTFLQGWLIYFITLRASQILHNKMLNNIIRAPVRFFDTNPSGRILNRFTKDIGFMDEQIPRYFHQYIHDITFIFCTLIAVCFVQVFLVIPIILFLAILLALRFYFLKASRQIKRFESNARSPIYSHISSTIEGLRTIRTFHIQQRVSDDYFYLQNNHSRSWFDFRMAIRWFALRIDLLTSSLVIIAIFAAFIARCILNYNELIEYSLSVLLFVPDFLQYAVRLSGEIEIFMVSVERIIEYTNIKKEAHLESTGEYTQDSPLRDNGSIHFNNVSFKYANELPYSLRNITITINAGEKVGIAGRTGAGKSSLLSALFRLNEIHQGSITINEINISTLPLHTLRKSISIIPQDAFLFSGTLRYNLDPFSEFSDFEIWQSLEKTYLKEMVIGKDGQLFTIVYENGNNFSAGQRQLVCLARALLRKNKIIVIDEATANVDGETDALLQKAICEQFAQCTVLTIAHRLDTIMDSNRILVMDEGRVAEFDSPSNLLNNPNSLLSIQLSQFN